MVTSSALAPTPVAPIVTPDALHRAFEAGYAAGLAEGKHYQARLSEQLRSQNQTPIAANPAPAPVAPPSSDLSAVTPVSPQPIFQPTGQAVPVNNGD